MTHPLTHVPLIAALLCLAAPALAQAPAQTPAPAPAAPAAAPEDKTALIQQLLTLTHARQNADVYLQILLNTEQKTLADLTPKEIAADPSLTPAQRALLLKKAGPIEARAMDQYRRLLTQQVDFGSLMTGISTQLFNKYYTADDLRSLIAFYQSPTGQKSITLTPQISAEAARLTQAALTPKLEGVMVQVFRQERQDWEHAFQPAAPPHHHAAPLT